jgi:hypothetical protein
MGRTRPGKRWPLSGSDIAGTSTSTLMRASSRPRPQRLFQALKKIVHFYSTRDVLPRCQPGDASEGVSCWPAPESTANMNTSKVGRLGPTDAEERVIVARLQTLSNGYQVPAK